jgi:hypothetical protein
MSKSSRKKFLCLDCGVDTGKIGEHYMLVDSTWSLTGLGKYGMLCVLDVEHRIKRKLVPSDFNDSYLNKPRTGIISNLLLSRMQGVDSGTYQA